MKLKYKATIDGPLPGTDLDIAWKTCMLTDRAVVFVGRERWSPNTQFHVAILDVSAGITRTFEVPTFHQYASDDSSAFAIGQLRDGRAAIFHSSWFYTIDINGVELGWQAISGASIDDRSGVLYSQFPEGVDRYRVSPGWTARDSVGRTHVLTQGQGMLHAIIDADSNVLQNWSVLDQAVETEPYEWENTNYFYGNAASARAIFTNGAIQVAAPMRLDMEIGYEYGYGLFQVAMDGTFSYLMGEDVTPFIGSVSEPAGAGVRFIDAIDKKAYAYSLAGSSITPLSGDWYSAGGIPADWVRPGERALSPITYSRGGEYFWGFTDATATIVPVTDMMTADPPNGYVIDLGDRIVCQVNQTQWHILEWGPVSQGVRSLRQRQTLTANTGSWPLRQRHNGGATGSWPLRQRQNAA